MYEACPECRVIFGRENGYFTGAMIVSYVLAVPLLAALTLLVAAVTHWSAEIDLLAAGVLFLAFVPPLFRYSRVVWMHFDRVVDPSLESERYARVRRPSASAAASGSPFSSPREGFSGEPPSPEGEGGKGGVGQPGEGDSGLQHKQTTGPAKQAP